MDIPPLGEPKAQVASTSGTRLKLTFQTQNDGLVDVQFAASWVQQVIERLLLVSRDALLKRRKRGERPPIPTTWTGMDFPVEFYAVTATPEGGILLVLDPGGARLGFQIPKALVGKFLADMEAVRHIAGPGPTETRQ